MASSRRIGQESAQSRTALLDAAERLMREEGYAAVTSRRVAERAKLKPQLVHYYFRTMDDLFVALLRRVIDGYLRNQTEIFGSKNPIRQLWKLSSDADQAVLGAEFLALANHRKSIRDELVRFSGVFRATQAKIISMLYQQNGLKGELLPDPIVLAGFIEAVARISVLEGNIGIDHGHSEATAYLEKVFDFFEAGDVEDPKRAGGA